MILLSSHGEYCPWLGQDKQVEVMVGIKSAGSVPSLVPGQFMGRRGEAGVLGQKKKGIY